MQSRTPMAMILDWIAQFPADELGRWFGHAAVQWPLVSLVVLAVIVGVAVRDVRRLRAADAERRALRPR